MKLYNPSTEHFIEQDDYTGKFAVLNFSDLSKKARNECKKKQTIKVNPNMIGSEEAIKAEKAVIAVKNRNLK